MGGKFLQECEHDGVVTPTKLASANGPICTIGGREADRTACTNALGLVGQASYRAGWACGAGGRQGYYTDQFPCFVSSQPTLQPNCDGMMLNDGSIRRMDGTIIPATGPGTSLG